MKLLNTLYHGPKEEGQSSLRKNIKRINVLRLEDVAVVAVVVAVHRP